MMGGSQDKPSKVELVQPEPELIPDKQNPVDSPDSTDEFADLPKLVNTTTDFSKLVDIYSQQSIDDHIIEMTDEQLLECSGLTKPYLSEVKCTFDHSKEMKTSTDVTNPVNQHPMNINEMFCDVEAVTQNELQQSSHDFYQTQPSYKDDYGKRDMNILNQSYSLSSLPEVNANASITEKENDVFQRHFGLYEFLGLTREDAISSIKDPKIRHRATRFNTIFEEEKQLDAFIQRADAQLALQMKEQQRLHNVEPRASLVNTNIDNEMQQQNDDFTKESDDARMQPQWSNCLQPSSRCPFVERVPVAAATESTTTNAIQAITRGELELIEKALNDNLTKPLAPKDTDDSHEMPENSIGNKWNVSNTNYIQACKNAGLTLEEILMLMSYPESPDKTKIFEALQRHELRFKPDDDVKKQNVCGKTEIANDSPSSNASPERKLFKQVVFKTKQVRKQPEPKRPKLKNVYPDFNKVYRQTASDIVSELPTFKRGTSSRRVPTCPMSHLDESDLVNCCAYTKHRYPLGRNPSAHSITLEWRLDCSVPVKYGTRSTKVDDILGPLRVTSDKPYQVASLDKIIECINSQDTRHQPTITIRGCNTTTTWTQDQYTTDELPDDSDSPDCPQNRRYDYNFAKEQVPTLFNAKDNLLQSDWSDN